MNAKITIRMPDTKYAREAFKKFFPKVRYGRDDDLAAQSWDAGYAEAMYGGMYEVGEISGVRVFADVKGSASRANVVATMLSVMKESAVEVALLREERAAIQQDGVVLMCAYCGHQCEPGTATSNHEALTAHVAICPMAKVVAESERLRDAGQKINSLSAEVHAANKKWWRDLRTGEPMERNVGEMLMLVTSELAEAMEGHRKNLQDDKLPHRKMIEVELADAMIRILDMGAGLGLDLGGAFVEKMKFNAVRHDHSVAGRMEPNGKKY
jgi:NTP pyrophosphatase (non-canonical NTP hydrolase)